LHPEPEAGPIAEKLSDLRCGGRADRLLLGQDIVKLLPGNTEQPRDLRLGQVHIEQNVVKHGARMGRAPVPVALGRIFGHRLAPQ